MVLLIGTHGNMSLSKMKTRLQPSVDLTVLLATASLLSLLKHSSLKHCLYSVVSGFLALTFFHFAQFFICIKSTDIMQIGSLMTSTLLMPTLRSI